MSNARENPPEHPAWTGRHPDAAGLEEELARAEDLFGPHTEVESAAGQRKQLASDAGLVALLREDGFQGALYDDCIRYLVEYGWPVLITWSVTGEIFRRAQHFGRPVPEELIGAWDRDGRYEVMADTVLAGIKTFREQGLVKGKWKPEGGATLKNLLRQRLRPVVPGRLHPLGTRAAQQPARHSRRNGRGHPLPRPEPGRPPRPRPVPPRRRP